jgi:hypothetical protein
VTAFTLGAAPEDEPVPVSVTVLNQGTADASETSLYVLAYWNNPPTPSDIPQRVYTVPALHAGESATLTVEFTPGYLTAGSQLVWVLADGRDVVLESDERNNARSTSVTIAPARPATSTATATPGPTEITISTGTPAVTSADGASGSEPASGAVSSAFPQPAESGLAWASQQVSGVTTSGASPAQPSTSLSAPALGGAAVRRPQRLNWNQPTRISSAELGGWFPDVAVDPSGDVHVVWHGAYWDRTNYVTGLFYSRGRDDGWTIPNDIALISAGSDGSGPALRASIATDGKGRLDLVYKGLGRLRPELVEQTDLWFTTSDSSRTGGASSWQEPRQVTRSKTGYFSDVVVDNRNSIHVLWTEDDPGGKGWGIYYSRSDDDGATWSDRLALDESSPVWWYRAQLVIDAQQRLHAVWEQYDEHGFGVTNGVTYARSVDGGRTWSTVKFGATGDPSTSADVALGIPQQPAIGVDGAGVTILVYRDHPTQQVLYRLSRNGTDWSAPRPIPGIRSGVARPYDVYDTITDGGGNLHLALVGYVTGSDGLSLIHSEWDGQRWLDPTVVTAAPPFPEYPKLAISRGNRLHLVWFAGDAADTSSRKPIGIWYSSVATGAPRNSQNVDVAATRGGASAAPTGDSTAPGRGDAAVAQAQQVQTADGADSEGGSPASPVWLVSAQSSPNFPLLAGVLPVLLLLLGVFVTQLGVVGSGRTPPWRG